MGGNIFAQNFATRGAGSHRIGFPILGPIEKHSQEGSVELQIPRLPRISCRTWWLWRSSCAFPY